MWNSRISLLGVLLLGASGCQCCALTEHYQDSIDHIADHSPHLDRFYHPGLDLTRIGYPDWCQSPVNRWLYGDCCCRDMRQQPAYIHNPMYVPQAKGAKIEPVPTEGAIPPRDDTGPDLNGNPQVPTKLKEIQDPLQLEMGNGLPPLPPVSSPLPLPPPE